MKTPLILLLIIGLALAAFTLFGPQPDPKLLQARNDLPWQVQNQADGTSTVFDLHLGEATLADAITKFGKPPEGLAVFERGPQDSDLEAYFGKVHFGPLQAKLVVRLQASESERRALMTSAKKRESSPTGDWKYVLDASALNALQNHKLSVITYVPGTRGLDRAFYLERFGEPVGTLTEEEGAVSWFYPRKGLSILIDEHGPEVIEYMAPKDFVLPEDIQPYAVEQTQ